MAKKPRRRKKTAGLPPGTLIFTGNQKMENPDLSCLQFNKETIQKVPVLEKNLPDAEAELVNWYDLRGLHDIELVERIGKTFAVHPIAMEDILDVQQRPKFEEYSNGFFFILKAIQIKKEEDFNFYTQQVAIFAGKNTVLSFQEDPDDLFLPVRERLLEAKGRIRERDASYLAYALLDLLVDHYYFLLDHIEGAVEALEDKVTSNPDENVKATLHRYRRTLLTIRREIMPLREAILKFIKSESPFIKPDIQPFLRDLFGHTSQIIESLDSYREMLNGLQDLYLSEISFQMNRVIQTLTIVATIFIPLTFLAGIYGMNFTNMPELEWENGYFILLGIMALATIAMVFYFWHKRWL
jgi:magnesium transporter